MTPPADKPSALDFVMDRIGLTFTATGSTRFEDETIAAARAELARLRQHADAGWRGLANIYHHLTGKDCDEDLALGLATAEVAALRQRAADLNACLCALTDHAEVMVYNYSKRNPNNRSVYEQLASLVGAAHAALRSGGEEGK